MQWRDARATAATGQLQGASSADGIVKVFRGVPFAAPPVGALRWRPPQKPASWSGVRPALANGPACVQVSRPKGSISDFGAEPVSEDCLYLNIWSAAQSPDERRPVMMWIHGGGFCYGSGSLPLFDGAGLARRGVVVVTINYRLGPLGFLAHPGLNNESPEGVSGNYGFLDQIAALDWVRENIAGFGGDPGRVTIFGQSVGSSSVCCLVASPLAKGLIHRAIAQSGGSMAPLGSPGGGSMQTLEQALERGGEFARFHGAAGVEDLRALPAEDLQLPPAGVSGGGLARELSRLRQSGWVIVDGHAIPASPHAIYSAGRQNRVPLMTGANAHEGSAQPIGADLAAIEADCRARFGDLTDAFFAAYGIRTAADFREVARNGLGERGFNWQNWTQLRLHAKTSGASSFGYYFARAQPLPPGVDYAENTAGNLGAFHTAEIPFAFDNLAARDWKWSADDRDLARVISSYWVNFASYGDPNGPGLPPWSAHRDGSGEVMVFGERAEAGPLPNRDKMEFWDRHFEALRGAGE